MPAEAFVDFDGTITDLDTFDVLVRHFAGEAALVRTERGLLDGSEPLCAILQRQASYVRGDFDEVADLLERKVTTDPGFPAFVARCRALGIPVTVVSSGVTRLIVRRLETLGLGDLPVVANDVVAARAGWRIIFRDAVANGTDKAAVVRTAHERGSRTLYIGDGLSDVAAALAADRRFARRGKSLEAHLRARRIAFEPFTSFADVTPSLDAAPLTTWAQHAVTRAAP